MFLQQFVIIIHTPVGPYLQDWLKYIRESYDAEQQLIANGNEFCIPYSG
jgi:hypothetical protein